MDYAAFLERKRHLGAWDGFDPSSLPDFLFPFQRALVEWATRKGRAALFADCGLGKTPMQLVWAENIVRHTNGRVPFRAAKEQEDEKHVHPLQLDVIERYLHLWSNPGETILTPFMGVGSEVYCGVQQGRKGIGIELKASYYRQAIKNLSAVDTPESEQEELLATVTEGLA